MGKPDFKFFDWDMNPIGKYKQPEPNSAPTGENGYPETGRKFVSQINLKNNGKVRAGWS